jgi:general secretion pathway protein D
VADGATVVIGGLLQERMIKIEDQVPVFGKIPLIGRLFSTEINQPSRKVVLFFVNVELLDPAGQRFRQR